MCAVIMNGIGDTQKHLVYLYFHVLHRALTQKIVFADLTLVSNIPETQPDFQEVFL